MRKFHRYTKEQIEYIRKIAEGRHVEEIHRMFNVKFNTEVTFKSIKGIMYRHDIKNRMQGYATRFENGQEAWNKGMKGLQLGGEAGWFKEGHLPPSHKPIGSESVAEDVVWMKVEEPNVWKRKHHYLYENHIGPIPEGYKVIFADGNNRNFDIDNLLLLSPQEFTAAVKRGLLFDTTEATKSGVLLAKYLMEVNKKKELK